MSLLADLLAKVKHSQSKREIPPNLRDIVSSFSQKSASKRKIILISVFFAVSIISSILIAYFSQSLIKKDLTGVGSQESGVRSQESGVRSQESGVKSLRSEVRSQELEKKIEVKKIGSATEKKLTAEKTQPLKSKEEKEAAEDKNTSQINAYLYSARKHEDKKDYLKAVSDYKKILEIDKDNFAVMNNIAYILLNLGFNNDSIKYSQTAINLKQDYIPALINLAIAHAALGNTSAAETYLNGALLIEPANKSVILNLAILYEGQKDYQRASEHFLRLSKLGDNTGSLGIARIYEKQDKKEEALKIYRNIYSLSSADNETRQMARERINVLSGK